MMKPKYAVLLLLGTFATAFAAQTDQGLLKQAQSLFKPLPKNMATPEFPVTATRVELGRKLFFDTRFSLDGTVSCARCHQAGLYGTDALPTAIGVKDRANPRNAPTVFNAALEMSAHWRGDRVNVEDQAMKALIGPPSFGQPDFPTAMAKIKSIAEYQPLFAAAFPNEKEPINPENWGKAIGAFERTLVTPSPFDAFLKGDERALSQFQKKGLNKFIQVGCVGCHNGVGVGGGSYQKFGVVEDYWKATGSKSPDLGRFDLTKNEADKYVFKVPSLRNVAMTPPYFHDGSVAKLPDAIRVMARVQLGKKLSDEDVKEIQAFLESLTGKIPNNYNSGGPLPAAAFNP